jgi:hypothetical protein
MDDVVVQGEVAGLVKFNTYTVLAVRQENGDTEAVQVHNPTTVKYGDYVICFGQMRTYGLITRLHADELHIITSQKEN